MWVRLLFVSRHNFPRYVNVVFDCFYREAYKISYIENWSAAYVHVRSHRSLNSLHALSQSLELSWSFPVTTMFLSDCFASLLWWCRWWWWRWWWRDFQFRSLSWELLLCLSKLLLRLRCRRPVSSSEIPWCWNLPSAWRKARLSSCSLPALYSFGEISSSLFLARDCRRSQLFSRSLLNAMSA